MKSLSCLKQTFWNVIREVRIAWFVGTCKGGVNLYNNYVKVFVCFINLDGKCISKVESFDFYTVFTIRAALLY